MTCACLEHSTEQKMARLKCCLDLAQIRMMHSWSLRRIHLQASFFLAFCFPLGFGFGFESRKRQKDASKGPMAT